MSEDSMKIRGDRSKKVGSCKRSAGAEASKLSKAKRPRGKPVVWAGGQEGYHKREELNE